MKWSAQLRTLGAPKLDFNLIVCYRRKNLRFAQEDDRRRKVPYEKQYGNPPTS